MKIKFFFRPSCKKRYNKRYKETGLNELLTGKCGNRQLLFTDNKNINLNMLNKRGRLHLNKHGTIPLVNNLCYNMNA